MGATDKILAPSRFGRDLHRQRGLARPIEHLANFLPMEDERADEEDATGQVPSEPYFLFVLKGCSLETEFPERRGMFSFGK